MTNDSNFYFYFGYFVLLGPQSGFPPGDQGSSQGEPGYSYHRANDYKLTKLTRVAVA